MKKIVLFIICIVGSSFVFSQEFQWKSRPNEFQQLEFRNDSVFALKSILDVHTGEITKLPYPIVFIHGLNSSSEIWNTFTNFLDSQYDVTYGGRFDFCLNADSDNATANTLFYPTPNADLIGFESNVTVGDYYYINFNVNPNGSVGTNVLSNQAAVAKQGKAIQKAIQRILELTNKEKVVLVGHSMGGLCAREYIQNNQNWQLDNQHHVAKLLSVGTPHGGSNASDTNLGIFIGVDTRSEAIRDLKQTYYYSEDAGRYLFGGLEVNDSNNMNEHLLNPDFYTIDVNCNQTIGDNIVGINQKPIDNYIDFSSVIGRITGGTTDGVVAEPQSLLQNYYPTLSFPNKVFYFNSTFNFVQNHTELTGEKYQLMQGLDEPNAKELAYKLNLNTTYTAFPTIQVNTANPDVDFYTFYADENADYMINISDVTTQNFSVELIDESGNTVFTSTSSTSIFSQFQALTIGTYYLKITVNNVTNTSYLNPYHMLLTKSLGIDDVNSQNNVRVYPNPTSNLLTISDDSFIDAEIYDFSGRKIFQTKIENQQINIEFLPKGVYFIELKNAEKTTTIKFIKE